MTGSSSDDSYYWDSYAHYGIHEEMLKDTVRTKSYQRYIYRNKHLFENKVVLDVGCGTGILSLFSAKAGAKKVYAVDYSNIVDMAKQIVALNGYEDVITVIRGKVEEIDLPEKVDIIVSEWMGYCLIFESMMNSVLIARDRFLKEDGILVPDKAVLKIAAIEDAEYKDEKIHYWGSVYGFDFSPIKEHVFVEPLIDCAAAEALVTNPDTLQTWDLKEDSVEGCGSFVSNFEITAARDDVIHALIVHFDIGFTQGHSLWFSTSCDSTRTHWQQTVFYLEKDVQIYEGEKVTGTFTAKPNAYNPRSLDISLEYHYDGEADPVSHTQMFLLR